MTEQASCPNGHEAPKGALFCPQCAAPLPASVTTMEGDPLSPVPPTTDGMNAPIRDGEPAMQNASDQLAGTSASAASIPTGEQSAPHGKSRRKRLLAAAVAVVLLAGAAGCAWWFLVRETDEDRYLAALVSGGFDNQFATPEVALATGEAFCASLAGGADTEGFDYEKVAVTELCPQFADAFKVLPTPEQLAAQYADLLREKGLGGKFGSDAAAVTHAQAICRGLDEGAAQQGPEVDAIAVSVYCPQYESGFKTLFPIKVLATFTLYESDPSVYYPSIEGQESDCTGTGGYADISEQREVRIVNSSGDLLTTANLGRGKGTPPYMCEFPFKFTVMDGEKGGYMIEVGDRGSIHFSAAQLKMPKAVQITLGE